MIGRMWVKLNGIHYLWRIKFGEIDPWVIDYVTVMSALKGKTRLEKCFLRYFLSWFIDSSSLIRSIALSKSLTYITFFRDAAVAAWKTM